jgi:hypothetical protein
LARFSEKLCALRRFEGMMRRGLCGANVDGDSVCGSSCEADQEGAEIGMAAGDRPDPDL